MKRSSLGWLVCAASLSSCSLVFTGCRSPAQHREKADEVAYDIIEKKQQEALGKTEPFQVERPSDILRRRLMEVQGLAHAGAASLGTDKLPTIPHWPEPERSYDARSDDLGVAIEPNRPLKISLIDALQIGARNSPAYQSQKETVFQAALDLDLRRNDFRNIFGAGTNSSATMNTTGDTVVTTNNNASANVSRLLTSGLALSSAIAIDLANLLTQGRSSTMGVSVDTSISMPLLRGAGRHIITENLTQAERNVVYRIWEFERYKQTFAVNIARQYYSVLRQVDSVANARANYESAVQSARWSRRRGDAGRISEIDVDQALQRELSARNGWITAQEQLKSSLDSFKVTIGLPVDAWIELDQSDLEQLRKQADEITESLKAATAAAQETAPSADTPVKLVAPSKEGAGPLEIDESLAVRLALEKRLDMLVSLGAVYDAQRQVVVRADALKAGLNLRGSASFTDNDNDGDLRFSGGRYNASMPLDLPIERTAQRNAYRNSLISLERATRSVQSLEDNIKLAIRDELRNLRESRESLNIQAKSVVVAEKRVRSTTMFLEAGRRQIRDLLDAQDSLLSARNQLTAAVVNYRIAELEIQRDLGILKVNERGLWEEFSPEDIKHDSQQQS
ncbi:MAG TPA: TolC family protein [Sedimentisphaerales bacterium]|nr:TolC family protein [Sedimentisphaerales bacterium]